MATKYADIRLNLTVKFIDDGERSLKDQAWDALTEECGLPIMFEREPWFAGGEVVGNVRDIEMPQ